MHTAGNGGDRMLVDMVKNDPRTSNYLAFAAPLKGRMTPPPPEAVAAARAFVFYRDPIKALVDLGSGRDVDTAIVEGKTLIQGGHALRVDEAEICERARRATARYWQAVPNWHWNGADVDRLAPPAFAVRRAGG